MKASAESYSQADTNVSSLHQALRDWIESRLPADRGMPEIMSGHLESDLQTELKQAGLDARLPELPDTLFVIAEAGSGLRGSPEIGWIRRCRLGTLGPGSPGTAPVAHSSHSQQCNSTWMGMTYAVHRLSVLPGSVEALISGHHGFWLGNDGPEFVLKPEELIMEFLDSSVDARVHNRTQLHRYSFTEGVRRLGPAVFQQQDFAEEWLTRPWSEMESRSAPRHRSGTPNCTPILRRPNTRV